MMWTNVDEYIKTIFDSIPMCCILWDEECRVIDCNEEAPKLFDLKNKKDYLAKYSQLIPTNQPGNEISNKLLQEKIKEVLSLGHSKFQFTFQNSKQEVILSEVTAVRVKEIGKTTVMGYIKDLRELTKMRAETDEANERTQIMLDATPLCCNFWDSNYNNVDCNQEAANLFELSSKQEYLEKFYLLSPEIQPCGIESKVMALENITKAFETGFHRFEWMHQKLNGEPVPSEITLVRVKYRGSFIVAGYTRDLRELKAMLAEMQKVENDLRQARDIAEKSSEAKSDFLANMSHEIRTPMNSILGNTHLLMSTSLDNRQVGFLHQISQSTKLLLHIINDVLDFSKIESGKLSIEEISFSFNEVLTDSLSIIKEPAEAKNLQLISYIDAKIPATLQGDPLRLEQILVNLLSNSVKFTSTGSIHLEIKLLGYKLDKAEVLLSVKDSGVGIPENKLKSIFEPFMQVDTSTTRKFGGTGLGLAISKNLANMMGGDLWCESILGEGATFFCTALFDIPKTEIKENTISLESYESLRGVRVLLAEDNIVNQMVASELMKLKGIVVDIANNGLEALSLLDKNEYDILLSDIQMPEMDGHTMAKEIRKIEKYHKLPIVAMTAHAMPADKELSFKSGMNAHITKPIEPEVLYRTLLEWSKKIEK